MRKYKIEGHEPVLYGEGRALAAVAVVFLAECRVEGPRAEMVELGVVAAYGHRGMLVIKDLVDQRSGVTARLIADGGTVLAAKEVTAVESCQHQERAFALGITE